MTCYHGNQTGQSRKHYFYPEMSTHFVFYEVPTHQTEARQQHSGASTHRPLLKWSEEPTQEVVLAAPDTVVENQLWESLCQGHATKLDSMGAQGPYYTCPASHRPTLEENVALNCTCLA